MKWITTETVVAFVLGVALSTMVKSGVARAKSKVGA